MRTVEEIYQEMRACFAQKTGMELHDLTVSAPMIVIGVAISLISTSK